MNSLVLKAWISAFRLRTLPLAIASITLGSFLAASVKMFHWKIFLFSIITTIFLQILSNLANDYGDSQNGADSKERVGPLRAVQSGIISATQMRMGILLFIFLSLLSGIKLLTLSFVFNYQFFLFLLLGIACIIAAIKYTAGKNPYGYKGLGDVFVFLFFGIVGVAGSYYLFTHSLPPRIILPAASCGFFSTAVLNINNIRDIISDANAGKRSIPVLVGLQKARYYHLMLLFMGLLLSFFYTFSHFHNSKQLLFLIVVPLLIYNGYKIFSTNPSKLDPYLKQMAITTLIFVITFGIGLLS